MSSTIIPFRCKSDAASALASFDVIAAELLADGRAMSLSAARLDAILAELRRNRAHLCVVLDDQGLSGLTGHAQLGSLAVNIKTIAGQGLAHIDQLIGLAEAVENKMSAASSRN
ncbi:hypothetical protein ACRAWG_28110 [Methylobacterium sp. P31]